MASAHTPPVSHHLLLEMRIAEQGAIEAKHRRSRDSGSSGETDRDVVGSCTSDRRERGVGESRSPCNVGKGSIEPNQDRHVLLVRPSKAPIKEREILELESVNCRGEKISLGHTEMRHGSFGGPEGNIKVTDDCPRAGNSWHQINQGL